MIVPYLRTSTGQNDKLTGQNDLRAQDPSWHSSNQAADVSSMVATRKRFHKMTSLSLPQNQGSKRNDVWPVRLTSGRSVKKSILSVNFSIAWNGADRQIPSEP
jgi:hypothetical protein